MKSRRFRRQGQGTLRTYRVFSVEAQPETIPNQISCDRREPTNGLFSRENGELVNVPQGVQKGEQRHRCNYRCVIQRTNSSLPLLSLHPHLLRSHIKGKHSSRRFCPTDLSRYVRLRVGISKLFDSAGLISGSSGQPSDCRSYQVQKDQRWAYLHRI